MDVPLRLQPYVWSLRQALAWGTIAGALCGLVLGLVDVWTVMPAQGTAINFFAQLGWKLVLLAGISGLITASAAIGRNLVTRGFYMKDRLETLRGAMWSYRELALAGFCASGLFPLVVFIVATRFTGQFNADPNSGLMLLACAAAGAAFLLAVGAARNYWVRRSIGRG